MTKEELEKATGQELIDERNYCGVDGYYGDYLDNVNTEILKRLNRLAELEQENKVLAQNLEDTEIVNKALEKENAELKSENQKWKDEWQEKVQKATDEGYTRTLQTIQLTKAKELLERFLGLGNLWDLDCKDYFPLRKEAEQFLSEEK